MNPSDTKSKAKAAVGGSHFHPNVPLSVSTYFTLPLHLSRYLSWLVRLWLPLIESLLFLGLALFSWVFLTPAVEPCIEISAR